MVNLNHTSDFAHILAHLWNEPASEPVVQNVTLSRFLNNSLHQLDEIIDRKNFDNKTLKDLAAWSKMTSGTLPELTTLVNFSRVLVLLSPDFQWTTHKEFRDQKIQNESCYKEKVR